MSENDDPAYDKTMKGRNKKAQSLIARSYRKGGEAKCMKSGGAAEGHHGKHKLDKYAGGGKVKGKKGVTVNVMVAPSQPQPPQKVPVPVPAGGAGGPPPPRPPMPPPQGGGMPPPGMGHPPMKRGGGVHYKPPSLPGGAGGGMARLKKAKAY